MEFTLPNYLNWFGRRKLIPWYDTAEAPLDYYLNPSEISGLPPYKKKADHHTFTWLGISVGVCKNIRDLDDSDYKFYWINKKCPRCSCELFGNKVGSQKCEGCDYEKSIFDVDKDQEWPRE